MSLFFFTIEDLNDVWSLSDCPTIAKQENDRKQIGAAEAQAKMCGSYLNWIYPLP